MNPILTCAATGLGLLLAGPLDAADLFYKKSLTLYVIHDVDDGKQRSAQLDTSVGKFCADAGAVVYLKGSTLTLIRDTREPVVEIIDRGVADFEFHDGIIAYMRDPHLYVRRLADDKHTGSRRVLGSYGVSHLTVAGGSVVFLKNLATLYRVTDVATGASERVVYPAGQPQLSGGR